MWIKVFLVLFWRSSRHLSRCPEGKRSVDVMWPFTKPSVSFVCVGSLMMAGCHFFIVNAVLLLVALSWFSSRLLEHCFVSFYTEHFCFGAFPIWNDLNGCHRECNHVCSVF